MYTAEELVWATQLAYCNFDAENNRNELVSDIFCALKEDELKEGKSEEEAGYSIYYSYSKENEDKATGDDATMIQETKAFIDAVAAGEKCKDWKIVDVRNDESDSGLYAVVIETAEDEASSFLPSNSMFWGGYQTISRYILKFGQCICAK